MKTLEELSHDTFYKMEEYHQISIDFVQDVEQLFDTEKPETLKEQKELLTEFGSLSYDLSLAIEVFNPEFSQELADLRDLESLVSIRESYVESLDFKIKPE